MKIRCLSWSEERLSLRIAPKTAASLFGKPASISVNPSSPSIRKAFENPIGITCTPLITRFTAICRTLNRSESSDLRTSIGQTL